MGFLVFQGTQKIYLHYNLLCHSIMSKMYIILNSLLIKNKQTNTAAHYLSLQCVPVGTSKITDHRSTDRLGSVLLLFHLESLPLGTLLPDHPREGRASLSFSISALLLRPVFFFFHHSTFHNWRFHRTCLFACLPSAPFTRQSIPTIAIPHFHCNHNT